MGFPRKAAVAVVGVALFVAVAGAGAAGAQTDYEWSIDLDCTECHAAQSLSVEASQEAAEKTIESEAPVVGADESEDEGEPVAMTGLEGYAAQHVEDFGFTCVSCHEDSDDLAAAHKKLNSGKEAKKLRRTTISSEVCTGCHKPEELAQATEGCELLVDANGTAANPHDLPDVADHESIACADCHFAHGDESLVETAMDVCASCHHARIFECHTCHK